MAETFREVSDARTRKWLAIVLIFMVCAALCFLFLRDVPPSNRELVSLVLGGLLTKLTDVFAYSFNSTASSHQKDAALLKAVSVSDTMAQVAVGAQSIPAQATPTEVRLDPGQSATVVAEKSDGATIRPDDGSKKVE